MESPHKNLGHGFSDFGLRTSFWTDIRSPDALLYLQDVFLLYKVGSIGRVGVRPQCL